MLKYSIRPALSFDVPALVRLFSLLANHTVSERDVLDRLDMVSSSAIDELFVAEVDGMTIAALGFSVREIFEVPCCYGEVSAIIVAPEFRRLGVGRRLMGFAEDLSRERGCMATYLVSGYGLKNAHAFYSALGYVPDSLRFLKPVT